MFKQFAWLTCLLLAPSLRAEPGMIAEVTPIISSFVDTIPRTELNDYIATEPEFNTPILIVDPEVDGTIQKVTWQDASNQAFLGDIDPKSGDLVFSSIANLVTLLNQNTVRKFKLIPLTEGVNGPEIGLSTTGALGNAGFGIYFSARAIDPQDNFIPEAKSTIFRYVPNALRSNDQGSFIQVTSGLEDAYIGLASEDGEPRIVFDLLPGAAVNLRWKVDTAREDFSLASDFIGRWWPGQNALISTAFNPQGVAQLTRITIEDLDQGLIQQSFLTLNDEEQGDPTVFNWGPTGQAVISIGRNMKRKGRYLNTYLLFQNTAGVYAAQKIKSCDVGSPLAQRLGADVSKTNIFSVEPFLFQGKPFVSFGGSAGLQTQDPSNVFIASLESCKVIQLTDYANLNPPPLVLSQDPNWADPESFVAKDGVYIFYYAPNEGILRRVTLKAARLGQLARLN